MRAQTRIIFFFFLTSGGDRVITQTEGVLLLFAFEPEIRPKNRVFNFCTYLYLKNNFFSFPLHFLARIFCAHLRAHIISLFFCVRARTRARKSRALRGLSMIVGGRVGALFFIVCFLSVLEIQIERFCISPPAWQIE